MGACSHGEDEELVVSALAINATITESLRWTDTRRGQAFRLDTLNVRMLPSDHLAAKAYGRRPSCRGTHREGASSPGSDAGES